MFRGLDFVLAEAAKRGLRLILVLLNYWEASALNPDGCAKPCGLSLGTLEVDGGLHIILACE